MVVRLLRGATVPVVLVGLLVLSGVAADRIYSGNLLTLLVAGAAVGSVLVSVVCGRMPAWSVAPVSTVALAGYLALALTVAARRAQIPGPLRTIAADSLLDGIPRLLAALVPVEPQPDTVAVPVLATWLTGLAATELAVRARRTTVGLVPPVMLYGGAIWLVGPATGPALWPTLLFAALAVAALALTGRVRTPDSGVDEQTRNALRLRTAIGAGLGVAMILVVAVVGGPLLTAQVTRDPLDPRTLVDPPDLDALDENPLIRLSGWALQPQQRLLRVTVSQDTRVRLAVLSDYDGVTWRVGATYRPAGRNLPEPPHSLSQQPVEQEFTVAGLTGKLLPAVATARRIDGVRVAYDRATGTIIRPDGLAPGLKYTVLSQRNNPDLTLLPAAEVPDASTMARYLALGAGVPEDLQRLADQLGSENGAPYQRAVAIEKYLSEHYRLDPQAASGHAYPNLDFFLFSPVSHGGQKGTSEQFAAAFAVLARLMNLPSRVVVGFTTEAGTHDITAGDALAWPEVYFQDIGWVPFQPLPTSDSPKPPEDVFKPEPETSSEPPPPSEAPVPTLEPTTAQSTLPAAAPAPAGGPDVAVIAGASGGGLLVVTVIALVLIVVIGRSRLRRGRLDTGSPSSRVGGAWLEVADALRLAGRPAPGHLSAQEVAAHAAAGARGRHTVRRAAPPIDDLADAVNESSFAPGATPQERAEVARTQALRYIDDLRARLPWWRRLIWTLHPGPLRWRRR